MKIIFCSEPFSPLVVDSSYKNEAEAARKADLDFGLIDYEALVDEENITKALRKIKEPNSPQIAVYRGWMLKPKIYSKLYEALSARSIKLINTPQEYQHCHYLPDSYSIIEEHTPLTVSIQNGAELSVDEILPQLTIFGDKPLILKDYVKSRKHEWHEACFIPSASDRNAVESIVKRFVELQGEDLNEGLVFREFVEFQPLTSHSKSQMPLTREFRLFFLDGELLDSFKYWDEGDYGDDLLTENIFEKVAGKVQSRFFTMDIARTTSGEWLIVELGDGQVAGLPDNADVENFYRKLKAQLSKHNA